MKSKSIRARRPGAALAALAALVLISLAIVGCANPASPPPSGPYTSYLYMVDSFNGKIYTYDPATHTPSSTALLSVQPSSGSIAFYNGIGYVAVGSGTDAGVYRFDPSATNPTATKIGSTIDAQYFAFYSATKAYVTAFDYSGSLKGVYSFNPLFPSIGLTLLADTETKNFQDIKLGQDGYVYAADNDDGEVYRINPENDSFVSINASAEKTTGLWPGTFNGQTGVFVANLGGSLDFIAAGAATATVVAQTSGPTPFFPGRIVQTSNGNLIATGYDSSFVNHSYLVSLSGTTATVSEITSGASPFGSLDIAYKDNLVYIPSSDFAGTNKLYVFDAAGTAQGYSPVSVMTAADAISNIAFYR